MITLGYTSYKNNPNRFRQKTENSTKYMKLKRDQQKSKKIEKNPKQKKQINEKREKKQVIQVEEKKGKCVDMVQINPVTQDYYNALVTPRKLYDEERDHHSNNTFRTVNKPDLKNENFSLNWMNNTANDDMNDSSQTYCEPLLQNDEICCNSFTYYDNIEDDTPFPIPATRAGIALF